MTISSPDSSSHSLSAVGDTFDCFEDAEHAVAEFGIVNGFFPGFLKSDSTRVLFRCGSSTSTCPWRARAWKGSGDRVKISRLDSADVHNCIGTLTPFRPAWSKSSFLVQAIANRMTVEAKISAKDIADVLRKSLRIEPSQAATYKAKNTLLGNRAITTRSCVIRSFVYRHTSQDFKLRMSIASRLWREPSAPAADWTEGKVDFKRCFVAPGPARADQPYCRPIVALDGTFLKGKVKLVLLLAATLDRAGLRSQSGEFYSASAE
ncbi:hypothetical protein CF326_g9602 [Tilletia indica]|nr:hypothetical protein CF326_g9602 [Tilletia indica]